MAWGFHYDDVDLEVVKHDLIDYYANPQAPITTKNNPAAWAEVQANLKTLQTMKTVGNLDPVPHPIEEAD